MNFRIPSARVLSFAGLALLAAAAACGKDREIFDDPNGGFKEVPDAGDPNCPFQCALDGRSVLRSCTGEVVETCSAEQACGAARCQEPCAAAADEKSSNGCEFYFQSPASHGESPDNCFATFVVNASTQSVNLTLEREGTALDLSKAIFRTNPGDATLIPHSGPIAPGESAILFVSDHDPERPLGGVDYAACPAGVVPAALSALSS